MISFKKLLPKTMQDAKWGSLIEVWQSVWSEIKTEKLKLISDQYSYDNVSEDDLKNLAIMFGFNLKSYTGYTSSFYYLKKQLETLVQRITHKTTPICYQYQGIPYNLISNGYSITYNNITQLYNVDESLIGEVILGTTYLDSETPSYLDVYYFPTLDTGGILYNITRNFAFNYIHKFVETTDEFLSINTLKSLNNDIKQFKRVTDRCYFEPYLFFEFEGSGIPTYKQWTDYSGGSLVNQTNIAYTDQFTDFTQIRFGDGSRTSFSGITDVESFVFDIDYANYTSKITEDANHYSFRTLISEGSIYSGLVDNQHFSGFTEIAVLNSNSGCILYSTFPKIQWDDLMFTNIKFDFQII
jgi:hypothetical protein